MIQNNSNKVNYVYPADFSFARNSSGYDVKGKLRYANQIRVTNEVYGGSMAYVEEATTNLLTENIASIEMDTTGFSANIGTETISRDSVNFYHGNNCLKVVTPGGVGSEGVYTSLIAVTPNNSYTVSVYVKGAGNIRLVLNERNSTTGTIGLDYVDIALTSTWTKYKVTRTFGSTGDRARIYLYTASTVQPITFYADCFQLEQKAYATTWTLPSVPRTAESLTMPVIGTNLLTDNQAGVEKDLTGFSSMWSASIARDTTEYYHGIASLKTVTPGSVVNEGFRTNDVSVIASNSYTASVWMKGAGNVVVGLYEYNSVGGTVGSDLSSSKTLTSTWTRYSVTRTFTSSGFTARIAVITTGTAQATTFYADTLQFERGPAASTWTLPDGTTNRMGLPPSQGTVEGIVEITNSLKSDHHVTCLHVGSAAHPNNYGLHWIYNADSNAFGLVSIQPSGSASQVYFSRGLLPDGIYFYRMAWNAAQLSMSFWDLKNQTLTTTQAITNPLLPVSFNKVYLGCESNAGGEIQYANTRYGRHRLSNIAITADPDFANLMPRDGNTVAIMDFDDIIIRGKSGVSI